MCLFFYSSYSINTTNWCVLFRVSLNFVLLNYFWNICNCKMKKSWVYTSYLLLLNIIINSTWSCMIFRKSKSRTKFLMVISKNLVLYTFVIQNMLCNSWNTIIYPLIFELWYILNICSSVFIIVSFVRSVNSCLIAFLPFRTLLISKIYLHTVVLFTISINLIYIFQILRI